MENNPPNPIHANNSIDDNYYENIPNDPLLFPVVREERYKSYPIPKKQEEFSETLKRQIKIKFGTYKFIKEVNVQNTVGFLLRMLKEQLVQEHYIRNNSNIDLLLKDSEGFIMDVNILIRDMKLDQVFDAVDSKNITYSSQIDGSLDNLDVPLKGLGLSYEAGKWKIRVAWDKRKNGYTPPPCEVYEEQLIQYFPRFLLDFYSNNVKSFYIGRHSEHHK